MTSSKVAPVPALNELRRKAAWRIARMACGGIAGVSKDNPIYVRVTEGRDGPGPAQRARYSSCADLAHWLLETLGCRSDFLNRKSLGGWVSGVNVSRLDTRGPTNPRGCPWTRLPRAGWQPEPGDILIAWNNGLDAHVMVAVGFRDIDGTRVLETANYGAGGMSPAVSPGARCAAAALTEVTPGKFMYGSPGKAKRVQRYISLDDVTFTALPNAELLATAGLTGEEIDALCAAVTP